MVLFYGMQYKNMENTDAAKTKSKKAKVFLYYYFFNFTRGFWVLI